MGPVWSRREDAWHPLDVSQRRGADRVVKSLEHGTLDRELDVPDETREGMSGELLGAPPLRDCEQGPSPWGYADQVRPWRSSLSSS
jgi:hypothetical protein